MMRCWEGTCHSPARFPKRFLIQNLDGDAIYCDAVEFYNPVHDITLPIVRAALAGDESPVFEVPLIYQKAGPVEAFELQRVPESLSDQCSCLQLSEEELAQKTTTLKGGVYTILFAQLGTTILDACRRGPDANVS